MRMTKLVSDLLTLARTDSGTAQLKRESFDFIPSVEQLVQSTQTLAQAKDIRLDLHAPASVLVFADPERLKQLLYILLDNAIKFTPEKGEIMVNVFAEDEQKKRFDRFGKRHGHRDSQRKIAYDF